MEGRNPNEMVLEAERLLRQSKALAYEVARLDYPDLKEGRFTTPELMQEYSMAHSSIDVHVTLKAAHGT